MSPDMKITQVKSNGKSLKNIELPDVMTAIRSGEQARVVNEHRGILSSSMPGDRNIHATDIPVLLFAARFRKKESRIEYQVYNGLVLMDVGNLADREEAVEVKRLASLAPQTMAAFVGSSGKSENTGSFCVARRFPSGKEGVGRVVSCGGLQACSGLLSGSSATSYRDGGGGIVGKRMPPFF